MPNEVQQIDCLTAMRRLWDYLDEELTERRMEEVREHLARCKRCLPHHDFARRFLEVLESTREDRLPPRELRGKVIERLSEAGFAPT